MSTQSDIIYKEDPTWDEYLDNIPIFSTRLAAKNNMTRIFARAGILKPSSLMDLSHEDLRCIAGVNQSKAKLFNENNMKYLNKGVTRNIDDLKKEETKIELISSGSDDLDRVMPGGGFETGSIIEVVGGPGKGKTQLCLTVACNTMRSKKEGGLNRSVLWIDSQRDFHTDRLLQVAGEMTADRLRKKFNYSKISDVDSLDHILDELGKVRWADIGCVIIDSLILPIKGQYPTHGQYLSNLRPLRAHLVKIFKKFRNLGKRYNLLIIFTNTLHQPIGQPGYYYDQYRPEGEVEMEHGTDMRLLLDKPNRKEKEAFGIPRDERGIQMVRVRIQNSNRIPERKGFFTIKEDGCSGSP